MKSKDLMRQELTQKFGAAMQSENQEDLVNAFIEFAEGIQQDVLNDFNAF